VSDVRQQYTQNVLLHFHFNNGYMKRPLLYIYTLPRLSYFMFLRQLAGPAIEF